MLKMAKYYFLLNWFQKTKKQIVTFLVVMVLFLMAIFMFNDLIAMSESKALLVLAKWIVLLSLLAVMAWNMKQIFNAVSVPFVNDEVEKPFDEKKERVLGKRELLTRSEQIYNKYRETE